MVFMDGAPARSRVRNLALKLRTNQGDPKATMKHLWVGGGLGVVFKLLRAVRW